MSLMWHNVSRHLNMYKTQRSEFQKLLNRCVLVDILLCFVMIGSPYPIKYSGKNRQFAILNIYNCLQQMDYKYCLLICF